jgi:hypothetical protein
MWKWFFPFKNKILMLILLNMSKKKHFLKLWNGPRFQINFYQYHLLQKKSLKNSTYNPSFEIYIYIFLFLFFSYLNVINRYYFVENIFHIFKFFNVYYIFKKDWVI